MSGISHNKKFKLRGEGSFHGCHRTQVATNESQILWEPDFQRSQSDCESPHLAGQGQVTYVTQLLGIDFGLDNLRGVGHRAVLQLVDALPIVDLVKTNKQKALFSKISLGVPCRKVQRSCGSVMTIKRIKDSKWKPTDSKPTDKNHNTLRGE